MLRILKNNKKYKWVGKKERKYVVKWCLDGIERYGLVIIEYVVKCWFI